MPKAIWLKYNDKENCYFLSTQPRPTAAVATGCLEATDFTLTDQLANGETVPIADGQSIEIDLI